MGTFGGSQDHTAILCCKPKKLSVYSFCPVEHHRDIDFPEDLRFVIASSGVVAEKTGEALEKYNAVSARARQLVALWNQSTGANLQCLREVIRSSSTATAELRGLAESDPLLLSRLDQFLLESEQIIPNAADAFEKQDWKALLSLVNASQHASENQLYNQVPQTIQLQRELLQSGAIAASAFGAGFGGSVWGLYRNETLHGSAESALVNLPASFVTRPGCAAFLLV